MSLSDENVVQENTGTSSATTSHAVSVGSGTTAGNTVIVIAETTAVWTAPAGFVLDAGSGASSVNVFRKSEVTAGETSWTFTTAGSSYSSWYVTELTNVDLIEPLDATASGSNGALANAGTLSTGTTTLNAGLSTVQFAAWGGFVASAATASWGSQTNSFAEVSDTWASGATSVGLSVSRAFRDGTTGTFQSTATLTTTTALNASARMVVYRAADSPIAAPLELFVTFNWGTHGGLGLSGATSLTGGLLGAAGTFGTNYLVQAASGDPAYVGTHFLRIVQTGGSGGVLFGNFTGIYHAPCFGFPIRVNSATGTVVLFTVDGQSDLNLVYNSSTNKLGLQWNSGTVTYQSGTTALGTWVWVDIRQKANTTTHHADWRVETSTGVYTDQTSPADATGASSSSVDRGVLGGYTGTLQTVSVDFGGMFMSHYYLAYPLGPHYGKLLVPETTGASVSGTSTNFSKFTANGTLAAWASDAGALLDEVPPTVSASSDGVVQTAVAASDYMQFPMTTYTLAYNEVIAGVRALFAEWGGTGTGTGTIGYRGWDGTTETTFQAASASYDADSLTAISGTYPRWCAAMWPSINGWTQTELNAAALRVGFSTDATPDMGISAAYLEVAVKQVDPVRTVTVEDPISATADIYVHPYTSSSVSYVITNNDASRSVNFNYSISGTPQTPVTVSPSSNQTVQVNADAFGDVSDVSLEPI